MNNGSTVQLTMPFLGDALKECQRLREELASAHQEIARLKQELVSLKSQSRESPYSAAVAASVDIHDAMWTDLIQGQSYIATASSRCQP